MMRVGLVVLAVVMLATIFAGGAGAGFVLLLPMFVLIKFGFLMSVFGGPRRGVGGGSAAGPYPGLSKEEFDEWHRLRHAREEVDSWVDDL